MSRDYFSPMKASKLYTSITKALSSSTNSKHLHKIHSLIITLGLYQSVFFSGNLISKYSQFKDPKSASSVFRVNFTQNHNVYLWNTIIRAMTHNGLYSKALDFYTQMRKLNVKPDNYTFPVVINACANLLDVEMGNYVQDHVLEMGLGSDLYICNSLIDMYSRMDQLCEARKVFDEMPDRDVVSWNSLISGYSSNGYWEEALEIFCRLKMEGVKPDCYTISGVVQACGALGEVGEGQVVHGLVEKIGIKRDVIVSNGLLSMYFKFDRVIDCQRLFDEMVVRDTTTWNTMICGYSQSGLYEESIKLFMEMVCEFEPDLLTMTSVLRACGHVKDLRLGKFIHDYMVGNGFDSDITANNIVINMYVKCGDMLTSREVFEKMESKDLVSWNSLIQGYVENGFYEEAKWIFKLMKIDWQPDFVTYLMLLSMCTELVDLDFGKGLHGDIIKSGFDSTVVVGNAVVGMYSKCGEMEDSLKLFENMKTRDVVTWNTVVAACGHSENCNLGLRMMSRMRIERMVPDVATFLGTLPSCSMLAAKRQGKELHGCILRLGFESDMSIGNALIDMYSKIGNLRYSILIFEKMKKKDLVSWTSMIVAYGMYGEGRNALKVFVEMKATGLVPDHIVFVAIIYACSHSGLVEEGKTYFDLMKKDYKIEPRMEHYACMVDLLSRSGLLHEAEKFILSMPLQPDASIWGALLSACRASRDTKLAERVSERIIQLNFDDPGYHVLASNMYAALGKWDQVKMIRKSLKARGLRKDPGRSWVEIQNRVYVFGNGDKYFEQYKGVKSLLETFSSLMAKEGYIADLKFVLHDVEEDEKVDMLCGHSERLAIAFGLLNTKPGTPLQIMKNLRVCGDCHTVTKYISKLVQREILVRDANRFHLFKDGNCSCGDKW